MNANTEKVKYGLVNRPAGIGAVPKGLFEVSEPLAGDGQRYSRHGVICFERELSDDEVNAFELVMICGAEKRKQLAKVVAGFVSEYAGGYLEMRDSEKEQFENAMVEKVKLVSSVQVYVGGKEEFAELVAVELREVLGSAA